MTYKEKLIDGLAEKKPKFKEMRKKLEGTVTEKAYKNLKKL